MSCRICFESGKLIKPCKCSGSIEHVHTECIQLWRLSNIHNREYYSCGICGHRYTIGKNIGLFGYAKYFWIFCSFKFFILILIKAYNIHNHFIYSTTDCGLYKLSITILLFILELIMYAATGVVLIMLYGDALNDIENIKI